MQPSPKRLHYMLNTSHLSVCPSVCPVPTVKLKTENHTAFKFGRDCPCQESLAEQLWGQKIKGQGHWKVVYWTYHEIRIDSYKSESSVTHVACCTFCLKLQQWKCLIFAITGQQCSSSNVWLRADATVCSLPNVLQHHCADVLFKVNTTSAQEQRGKATRQHRLHLLSFSIFY